jgi:hypothetical protein
MEKNVNTIKKLSAVFNWLDEKPKNQYTLGELAVKLSDGTVMSDTLFLLAFDYPH